MQGSAFTKFCDIKKSQGFQSAREFTPEEFAQWSWFHAGWSGHRKSISKSERSEYPVRTCRACRFWSADVLSAPCSNCFEYVNWTPAE